MPDLCRQCASDHGLPPPSLNAPGLTFIRCRACGLTWLDPRGLCVGGCDLPHPLLDLPL